MGQNGNNGREEEKKIQNQIHLPEMMDEQGTVETKEPANLSHVEQGYITQNVESLEHVQFEVQPTAYLEAAQAEHEAAHAAQQSAVENAEGALSVDGMSAGLEGGFGFGSFDGAGLEGSGLDGGGLDGGGFDGGGLEGGGVE